MSSNRVIDPRAAERRRSILFIVIAAVVLIAVAAVVIIWALPDKEEDKVGGAAVPTVTTDGAIRFTGAPKDTTPPVVVTITEDFQCPACASFEQQFGPTLNTFHDNPKVALDYVTVTMLDKASTTNYSSRAANAAMCVAEATGKEGDFGKWLEYHNLLFASQPAEGGAGLDDDKLIGLAKDAGVDGISNCVNDKQFGKWINENSTKAMDQPGFSGTPNVRINGKVVQASSPADLQAKIDDAVKAAP